ncbi:MAG: hypothetical protein SVV03_05650, partial [Candidatus Nanohaloarchaea archaeon]|nr:hypothetical protein [Candidatus Nanohaloarchaea archaeon]
MVNGKKTQIIRSLLIALVAVTGVLIGSATASAAQNATSKLEPGIQFTKSHFRKGGSVELRYQVDPDQDYEVEWKVQGVTVGTTDLEGNNGTIQKDIDREGPVKAVLHRLVEKTYTKTVKKKYTYTDCNRRRRAGCVTRTEYRDVQVDYTKNERIKEDTANALVVDRNKIGTIFLDQESYEIGADAKLHYRLKESDKFKVVFFKTKGEQFGKEDQFNSKTISGDRKNGTIEIPIGGVRPGRIRMELFLVRSGSGDIILDNSEANITADTIHFPKDKYEMSRG